MKKFEKYFIAGFLICLISDFLFIRIGGFPKTNLSLRFACIGYFWAITLSCICILRLAKEYKSDINGNFFVISYLGLWIVSIINGIVSDPSHRSGFKLIRASYHSDYKRDELIFSVKAKDERNEEIYNAIKNEYYEYLNVDFSQERWVYFWQSGLVYGYKPHPSIIELSENWDEYIKYFFEIGVLWIIELILKSLLYLILPYCLFKQYVKIFKPHLLRKESEY